MIRGDWLNRTQLCKLLAIDPTNFDKSWRPLVPEQFQRREGQRLLFHVRSVIDAYIEREVEKRSPKFTERREPVFDDDADGILIGPPSDWLEQCRKLKAQDLALDLDVRRGNLIPREEIGALLARLASVLRPAGEKLQRQYGADAGLIYNEAVDELARLAEDTGLVTDELDG